MEQSSQKKAIVIGASSGIGSALAVAYGKRGYDVGLMARRVNLLNDVAQQIPGTTYIKQIDIARTDTAPNILTQLIDEMGGVDVIVINSGVRYSNKQLHLKPELDTIAVNAVGFAAVAVVAVNYFLKKDAGHLIGISSIAGLRGSPNSPSYNASKAFVSKYLNGLYQKCINSNVTVTDIRPGFVETAMIADIKKKFWVATPEQAARQILRAMDAKKKVAYVTRRYVFLALLMRLIPDRLVCALYRRARD